MKQELRQEGRAVIESPDFRTRWIRREIEQWNAFVMPERIRHIGPIENVPRSSQRLGSVFCELVIFAPGHSRSAPFLFLGRSLYRRHPAKQEEVAATQRTSVGPEQPVKRPLDAVARADASEVDRSAIRTVGRGHLVFLGMLAVSLGRAADHGRTASSERWRGARGVRYVAMSDGRAACLARGLDLFRCP